ncbi:hypothetical protein [Motilibacter deserti]|uniref:Fibronectin type-III domain-containing protein n=1 Tax=Motilibacter deserti TaxID=2714956 RepID=A0ABX0GT71_9ACTN|nr:hypothetical protein [Motilibacter deserti]NHC12945.1 hypothetical protein [Motilibacter deserti]
MTNRPAAKRPLTSILSAIALVLATLSASLASTGVAHADTCKDGVCITAAQTGAGLSNVTTTLQTNVPTTAYYYLFDSTGGVAGAKVVSVPSTTHVLSVDGLSPANDYTWWATVIDASGAAVARQSTVSTQRGRVQVRFDTADVWDDSDFWSAGDMSVYGRAGDAQVTIDESRQIDGDGLNGVGTSLHGLVLTVPNTAPTITAAVEMYDDDCDFFELCVHGLGPSWGQGSDSEADWATAWATAPTRNQDGKWHPFHGRVDGPVGFSAQLSYRVVP